MAEFSKPERDCKNDIPRDQLIRNQSRYTHLKWHLRRNPGWRPWHLEILKDHYFCCVVHRKWGQLEDIMDEEVATNTNIDVTWTKAHEAIRDYCTEEIKSDDRDSSGTVSSPRHQILKYNVICERLRNGEKKEAPLHFTREEKVFFGSQYPRLKRHFDKETLTVLCRKLSTDLAIWAEQTHRQDLVVHRTADKINSVLKGQLRDRGVKGWLYRKYVKHCEGSRYLGASDYDIRLEDAPPKAGIKRGRYHSASDASEDAELPKPKRVGMIPLFNSDEDEDTD